MESISSRRNSLCKGAEVGIEAASEAGQEAAGLELGQHVQREAGGVGPRPWPRLHEMWIFGRIMSRGDRTYLASQDPSGY